MDAISFASDRAINFLQSSTGKSAAILFSSGVERNNWVNAKMLKLVALFALVMIVTAQMGPGGPGGPGGPFRMEIPGVSAASMERLHQMMNPRPNGFQEFRQRIEQWENSLPEAERQAAQAHRERMRQRHREFMEKGIPGVSKESMQRLHEMMRNSRPEGREAFRQRMDEWVNSLSPEERAAAEAHRQQMRERFRNFRNRQAQ
ncbi:unnamed protein product [Cylicocyclus nassatus]|uniref:Uncharacterized protein n=1 Tax=Cylicocyclus nassatus TaxID=53992 RepID=A0AA36GE78_CYLNA|nr:unnamed protein product [Cylicocyclus nassatus]